MSARESRSAGSGVVNADMGLGGQVGEGFVGGRSGGVNVGWTSAPGFRWFGTSMVLAFVEGGDDASAASTSFRLTRVPVLAVAHGGFAEVGLGLFGLATAGAGVATDAAAAARIFRFF